MQNADDKTPFKMPAFSGRNILIFSDGTGQAGGLLFDESRSNVYKLYRATRCGPDTNIDPDKQLAFYDPGLGSKSAGGEIKIGWLRWLYNVVSSATGLGITQNIIECYCALLYLWRPGDRIFLFGFSRGAYTIRCLGGVLGLCGIPTKVADGKLLLRDPGALRRISSEAVRRVYGHGSGASEDPSAKGNARKEKLGKQRRELGEDFRKKYSSEGPLGANAVPHFIGVWDTVAAVGLTPPAWNTLRLIVGTLVGITAAGIAWFNAAELNLKFAAWFAGACLSIGLVGYLIYLALRLKFVTSLRNYKWYETIHLTSFKMTFFDRTLNKNVRYARHALALDERRADFDRVPWVNDGQAPNREIEEGAWFQQYWFAGNHSDIGGSYEENESRLSDLALGWMSSEAKRAGLIANDNLLNLFGRPNGPQHDECRTGISFLGMKFKWREALEGWSTTQRFIGQSKKDSKNHLYSSTTRRSRIVPICSAPIRNTLPFMRLRKSEQSDAARSRPRAHSGYDTANSARIGENRHAKTPGLDTGRLLPIREMALVGQLWPALRAMRSGQRATIRAASCGVSLA